MKPWMWIAAGAVVAYLVLRPKTADGGSFWDVFRIRGKGERGAIGPAGSTAQIAAQTAADKAEQALQ